MEAPFRGSQLAVIGLFLSTSIVACQSSGLERAEFRPGRRVFDTQPIAVADLAEDVDVRAKVLGMSFGEAAYRLGSLRFAANTHFVFVHGGERAEQHDSYEIEQTPDGDFHVLSQTPTGAAEVFLKNADLYVRMDKGPLRRKQRRGVETDTWCEVAYASMRESLQLFGPRLTFKKPTRSRAAGRQAVRFALHLEDENVNKNKSIEWPRNGLPMRPLARWRALARPLDIRGSVWVDSETGVITRAEIDGRLEIADREVRPTVVTLSVRTNVSDVGKVHDIDVPSSVKEFRRTPPPRDLLGFFREHLEPAPEQK